MSTSLLQRGRPRGPQRDRFSGFVTGSGQFTLRDVMHSLEVGMDQANKLLRRSLQAREIHQAGTTRLPDAKRPVAVYTQAGARSMEQGTMPLAAALRCWAR